MTVTDNNTVAAPMAIASSLFGRLEQAWNNADGVAFGEVFADETDFVHILGVHIRGDGAFIGDRHQEIFDTIYAGSTVRYDVDVAREVAPGCVLAVVTSTLNAPTGPLPGINQSRMSAVITQDGDRESGDSWKVTAFHNTLVRGFD
jgi:uncharacterized protein (TIGR02246 family)